MSHSRIFVVSFPSQRRLAPDAVSETISNIMFDQFDSMTISGRRSQQAHLLEFASEVLAKLIARALDVVRVLGRRTCLCPFVAVDHLLKFVVCALERIQLLLALGLKPQILGMKDRAGPRITTQCSAMNVELYNQKNIHHRCRRWKRCFLDVHHSGFPNTGT